VRFSKYIARDRNNNLDTNITRFGLSYQKEKMACMPNMYITIKYEICFKRKELTPRLY